VLIQNYLTNDNQPVVLKKRTQQPVCILDLHWRLK